MPDTKDEARLRALQSTYESEAQDFREKLAKKKVKLKAAESRIRIQLAPARYIFQMPPARWDTNNGRIDQWPTRSTSNG